MVKSLIDFEDVEKINRVLTNNGFKVKEVEEGNYNDTYILTIGTLIIHNDGSVSFYNEFYEGNTPKGYFDIMDFVRNYKS